MCGRSGCRYLGRQIRTQEAVWLRIGVVLGGQLGDNLCAVVLGLPDWLHAVGLGVFGGGLSGDDN